MPITEDDPAIRDSSVYWFVTLEEARRRGQFRRAEHAQKELERLGILVKFTPGDRKAVRHD